MNVIDKWRRRRELDEEALKLKLIGQRMFLKPNED